MGFAERSALPTLLGRAQLSGNLPPSARTLRRWTGRIDGFHRRPVSLPGCPTPLTSMTRYAQLLEEAWELGRADGRFAAAFETPGTAPLTGERSLGRTPAEFARLLWEHRPGAPPSGLEG